MTNLNLQFVDVDTSAKQFGDWLRLHRKKAMLSMEALGKKVGVSKQYISVLERAENHALTGKPVTPERDKVASLAEAVGGDVNEALRLTGYASERTYPQTEAEFIEALKEYGVCNFQLPKSDLDKLSPEFYRDVLEFFENTLRGKIAKLKVGEPEAEARKLA